MFTQRGGHRNHLIAGRPLFSVLVWLVVVTPAHGLTINLFYDPINSEGPGHDPAGLNLMTIVQAAADRWEEMILDPWSVSIQVRWEDPADMFNSGALAEGISVAQSLGKPAAGYVYFNNTKDFFFDPTPLSDEEFNMQQTLYRDIDPILQASWYGGAVPDVYETAYRGDTLGGQPTEAYDTDLFSVAIHEIGHVLGMNATLNSPEVDDGDYDINPSFVGGANMHIDDSDEHLPVQGAALFPSIGSGERKRITDTDLMAVASAVNWLTIDTRRKNYLGGAILTDPFNWIGNRLPSPSTDAYIRKNQALPPVAVAQASMSFKTLHVLEGSWITSDHLLNAIDRVDINGDGSVGGDSRIRIQSNGTLMTDKLLIDSNGTLELIDGFADIDEDVFIAIGGTLKGYGFALIDDRLTNNGLISAENNQTLSLTTTSPDSVEVWDLGGSGGVVEAINGDIFVHGSHFGEFKGSMTIGGRRRIDMDRLFTLNATGFLNLDSSPDLTATFSPNSAILKGSVDVDHTGVMEGTITLLDPVSVTVNDSTDRLRLQGFTNLRGGSYTGSGAIVQENDIKVQEDTTIDAASFLWGNSPSGGNNELRVEPNATLVINSDTTNSIGNRYQGDIVLSSGAMEVNTLSPWTLPQPQSLPGLPDFPKGSLIMDSSKVGLEPTLRGQKLILEGLIGATGGFSYIEAELDTMPSGEINIVTNSHLVLQGATNYNGGNIHGGGKLWQQGDAIISGSTTINTTFMDWDGDEANPSNTTVNPGVIFTIQSESIEADPVFEGHSGHITVSDNAALVVITDITWLTDGLVTLLGQPTPTPQAIVDGTGFGNFGRVEGNGWFQSIFANAGTLSPGLSAGAMRFSNTLILYNESIVEIEVGGDIPITTYDQLRTDNTVFINGQLDVNLINGFVPPAGSGDQYDILVSAAPITGTFDAVNLPASLGLLYSSHMVSLIAGLPGDLNGDGFVGIDDLNIVLTNWNSNADPGVWSGGDPSGDGFIGIDDLNTVLGNWNAGTPPPSNLTNIPEPSGCLLLLASGTALAGRHKHRL